MRLELSCCLIFLVLVAQGQQDTVRVLDAVTVKAYAYDNPVTETPVSVSLIDSVQLNRFGNSSLLPVVNMQPGVRMEERSPGSYRFAIRGSSLRSPFGVRNVKFYWKGLPLTDGGGNTYLNLLDFNSIGSLEIIKGPGGSLYGAGTGGVVLLEPAFSQRELVSGSLLAGSYGLRAFRGTVSAVTKKLSVDTRIGYQHADGYREQSEMSRLNAMINLDYRPNTKSTLSTTLLTGQLFYETPGGLTESQYAENPQQARPPTATQPGAVDQRAAVTNQTTYIGIQYATDWNDHWATSVGVYGALTDFENPTIRNYEKRLERNGGWRAHGHYNFHAHSLKGKVTLGTEAQFFASALDVFGNDRGDVTAQVFSSDRLSSSQQLVFLQTDLELPFEIFATLGGSFNFLQFTDKLLLTNATLIREFDPEFSPRLALLKKVGSHVSLFGSMSRGFSAPTFAEVVPSAGGFNQNLNAERGTNYEVGIRGKMANNVFFDVVGYTFQLNDAIVIQRAADGSEFFVNAGETKQQGIEGTLNGQIHVNRNWLKNLKWWLSYTRNAFSFEDYVHDGNDYSGNKLTGVPPQVVAGGFDLSVKSLYVNLTATYTDRLPLNDANTAHAAPYWLLGARVGYRRAIGRVPVDLFGGVDNLLDEQYSLGNDLNALGGRFYNAAPRRNYFLGLNFRFGSGKQS